MSSGFSPAIERLNARLAKIKFSAPITHVYNPLEYARELWDDYFDHYARHGKGQTLILGMNPGPWGMAQDGVPFGEVSIVRDWLKVKGNVKTPRKEHPKRPVLGLACKRSEVSGARLWGWARDTFETPENFFKKFFVGNYCPLSFMEESGRNFTPDKLPTAEREALFDACDEMLRSLVEYLGSRRVMGVGAFAANRARKALGDAVEVSTLLHPSPASPAANKGWAKIATKTFQDAGLLA